MPNITQAEVQDTIATIIAAEALGYLKGNTILARLINRDYEDEVASYGDTVEVPVRGALSVNDKAAGTPVTLQNPTATTIPVVLNKHKEVSFLIEDVARILARPDLLSGYMQDGMAKLAETLDGDIAALHAGLSQTIDATGTFDDATFVAARRLLSKAKAPTDNRWAILSPDAESAFLAFAEVKNADYTGEQAERAVRDGFVGRFRGFNVAMSHSIQNTGAPPGTDHNLFFHRDFATLVTRPLPVAPPGMGVMQKTMSEDGIGIRVTMSYSANHLGYQVTLDILYGLAELRDTFGVRVNTAGIA